MTIAPMIEKLLAALPPSEQLQFAELCEALYTVRFTGITPIHWRNGVPHQIEIGAPVKLTIVQGQTSPTPPAVDKPDSPVRP